MHVITMLNQKGGVGKTSLTHHLGGAMASPAIGLRVLAVDYDPQASLTQGLFGPDGAGDVDQAASSYAIAAGDEPEFGDVVLSAGFLDVIPAVAALAEHNRANPESESLYSQCRLRDFLEPVKDQYDVILIDCPPNLQLLASQALFASTRLIIPCQAEDYGVQGLRPVMEFLATVRAQLGTDELVLLGIILNLFDKRIKLHQFYEARLRQEYGESVFATTLPKYSAFPEAVLYRLPVTLHDPLCTASKMIFQLVDELVDRLAIERKGASCGKA